MELHLLTFFILLACVLYPTSHGKLLSNIFPIMLPENPFDLNSIFKLFLYTCLYATILKYVKSHTYVMPNITLSIPDEIYKKMKKYREVRWSEVARKAIVEYLKKLEGEFKMSTEELLEELGEEFAKDLSAISFEKAVEWYEKMRETEWRRFFTTRAA